uniref:Uncharacterized protein n=1 Tax=Anguilla anguilla TaxID=7936 RepID=A0A0E9QDN9_ANGAN
MLKLAPLFPPAYHPPPPSRT